LSDANVVNLISSRFVPVALNRQEIRAAKDEGGDFFRSVQTQAYQHQGIWLASPDGRVLVATGGLPPEPAKPGDHDRKILKELREGMKAYGRIAPRLVGATNPLPYRGIGVRPDGGATLAVSGKDLPTRDLTKQIEPFALPEARFDSVVLSAAEWSALAPPDVRVGSRWAIPEAAGRRFFSFLSPVDAAFHDPAEVTEVQFAGRVASVRDGIALLLYQGTIAGTHHGAPNDGMVGLQFSSNVRLIAGKASYHIETKQMLSLLWVGEGSFWGWHEPGSASQRARIGLVAEWRREAPKAGAQLEAKAPGSETKVELADSTPEAALKTFLLALAAQDEATLRAVTLPHAEFDLLLKSPLASPDRLALLKARLEEKPMRRLKEGDPVRMPDGETRVIKPVDVREGRVVLWPAGAPLPSRLENVDGHWKVFADPFIAVRKYAEGNRLNPVSNP